MRLTDLQDKEIVDINTGKVMGTIIDVLFDCDGKLRSLIVEKSKFLISMFTTKDEIEVKWNQVEKIGEDIILVRLNTSEN